MDDPDLKLPDLSPEPDPNRTAAIPFDRKGTRDPISTARDRINDNDFKMARSNHSRRLGDLRPLPFFPTRMDPDGATRPSRRSIRRQPVPELLDALFSNPECSTLCLKTCKLPESHLPAIGVATTLARAWRQKTTTVSN
jgi:hypothetical protein